MSLNNNPTRRPLLPILGTILLAACTGVAQAASFTMYRDPSCGCCESWAAHVRQCDRHDITTVEHPDMASVKTQNDVPDDLRSCHTMIAVEYVIAGDVQIGGAAGRERDCQYVKMSVMAVA